MGRLRARLLVLVLGGILVATAALFGGATDADAQVQGQAKGKAQVQGKGQDQENGWPPGHNKVAVCHKPLVETTDEETDEEPGEEPEEELAEETGHILYLPPPAAAAHERHGDKELKTDENGIASSGECGTSGTVPPPEDPAVPPPEDPEDPECLPAEVFGTVEVETVNEEDVITIIVDGDFELATTTTGTVSLTLRDEGGTEYTFTKGVDNVDITEVDETLRIAVGEDIPELSATTVLEVVSSDGILCPEPADTGETDTGETDTGETGATEPNPGGTAGTTSTLQQQQSRPDEGTQRDTETVRSCDGKRIELSKREKLTLDLHNKTRKDIGLRQLCVDPTLQRAARAHSADMLRKHYFGHNSLDGKTGGKRLKDLGYDWRATGENIAWGSGSHSKPKSRFEAWLKSEGHRKNILDGNFEQVGVGVAQGKLKNGSEEATFYTVDFGSKKKR
jgi:uncharacterized protein YkwD